MNGKRLSKISVNINKQRLIPLTGEIIKTMALFKVSSSSLDVQNPNKVKITISKEVQKAVYKALGGLPGLDRLVDLHSLNTIIQKFVWGENSNPSFQLIHLIEDQKSKQDANIKNFNIQAVKRSDECNNDKSRNPLEETKIKSEADDTKNEGNLISSRDLSEQVNEALIRNWSKMKHKSDVLEQKAKLLEQEIMFLLRNIPAFSHLHLSNLNLNVDTIVERFSAFVDKEFNDCIKTLILEKLDTSSNTPELKTANPKNSPMYPKHKYLENLGNMTKFKQKQEKKNILRKLKPIAAEETAQMQQKSKAACHEKDSALEENRKFYERQQYEMNTRFFIKSRTTVELNKPLSNFGQKVPFDSLFKDLEVPFSKVVRTSLK